MQGNSLTVKAYAKVNLHLEVLGKRPDGYHELRTLMHTVDLWDLVRVEVGEGVEVTVEPHGAAPTGSANLAWRAVDLARRRWGVDLGASILISKNIPVGAGLGGGSSDAAAVLMALPKLWGVEVGVGELLALAAELGADVPFFLVGGLALCLGRGDEVCPLPDVDWGDLEVVLATPGVGCPTADVYRRLGVVEGSWRAPSPVARWPLEHLERRLFGEFRNDLAMPAINVAPEISPLLRGISSSSPLYCNVTGSGSAVFGIFRSGDGASVLQRLGATWGRVVGFVPRSSLESVVGG